MTSEFDVHNVVMESVQRQINWYSTSNPFFSEWFSIAKDGFVPISVGYTTNGTNGSYNRFSAMSLDPVQEIIFYECRMTGQNPATVTQNKVTFNILYMRK